MFNQKQTDPDRSVAAEVAQSHNMGRSKESRMRSAQRASDTYEEATGNPLEIDKRKFHDKNLIDDAHPSLIRGTCC